MLDRTQKPGISDIGQLSPFNIPCRILQNGIPLYSIDMGEQEVNRIDLIFTAGTYEQRKKLTAQFANLMLKEGAGGMKSKEIAERLDYLGAWLQPAVTRHNSYVTLYSLNKFFEQGLDILEKIVKFPEFPEQEFGIIADRLLQQYLIDQSKVQILALNAHTKQIYGNHPYGQVAEESDYKTLNTDDLRNFHAHYYQPQFCKIILTGKLSPAMFDAIERVFGNEAWTNSPVLPHESRIPVPTNEKEVFIEKDDSLQSAVRMGIHLPVNRSHPDYNGLRVLNTALGGYFGSRLMSNIREDKGYTYGINSAITSFAYSTTLSVASQTGVEFTRPLINEVFHETERLKTERMSETELNMVKSYMQGELARVMDGPFAIADSYQAILVNRLPADYYEKQFNDIRATSAEKIQELAVRYLNNDAFYITIAGKRS